MKDSVLFYISQFRCVEHLSDEDLGKLFRALFSHAQGGEAVQLTPELQMAFSFLSSHIDRDEQKYNDKVEKRRAAGLKGSRQRWAGENGKTIQGETEMAKIANANFVIQEETEMAKIADSDSDNDNDSDSDNDSDIISPHPLTGVSPSLQSAASAAPPSGGESGEKNTHTPQTPHTPPPGAPGQQPTLEERRKAFADTLAPYVETYGRDMVDDFYRYWTEPTHGGRRMRFETERTWSVNLRLATWSRREDEFRRRRGRDDPDSRIAVKLDPSTIFKN